MSDCRKQLEVYMRGCKRRIKEFENKFGTDEKERGKKCTYYGGREIGLDEGKLDVLEDIFDMVEDGEILFKDDILKWIKEYKTSLQEQYEISKVEEDWDENTYCFGSLTAVDHIINKLEGKND